LQLFAYYQDYFTFYIIFTLWSTIRFFRKVIRVKNPAIQNDHEIRIETKHKKSGEMIPA
jgi:hypothetical protein